MARRDQEVAGKGVRSKKTRVAAGPFLPLYWPAPDALFVAVYDWHVREDRLQGDLHFARLFSKLPDEVSKELPIAKLLERIHPEDLKQIEDDLAEAVEKRDSFSASYRVRDGEKWKYIDSIGRCHQIEGGDVRFTGVLIARDEKTPADPPAELPPRELECLSWCSQGKTNWEIGRILGISERTVEHHIASAVRRLGCTGRVQAVALALRSGLIK